MLECQVDTLSRERDENARQRDEHKQRAEFLLKELERIRDGLKTGREHVDANELQLVFTQFLERTGAAPSPKPDVPAGKPPRRRTPHGRNVLPEHLPVETITLDVAPGATVIGEEVSWRLGFRRGGFYRLKIVRPIVAAPPEDLREVPAVTLVPGDVSAVHKPEQVPSVAVEPVAQVSTPEAVAEPPALADSALACAPTLSPTVSETPHWVRCDIGETTVACALAPDEVIPRGLPTVDVLAHVLTSKFADKLPFRRQEGIYGRVGVHVPTATMCGWARASHELAHYVVDAMTQDSLHNAHFIATDSTGVLVQANDKCRWGHFWVFVSDVGHVVFRYSPHCTSQEPLTFFRGFRGVVVADASSVYDAMFGLPQGPKEAGCFAHARRYFYKALPGDHERALIGIGLINELFDVEREIKDLSPGKRLVIRQERSGPVITQFERWRADCLAHPDVADGTAIRRALNYTQNHWSALCRFLEDGRIPIHNNWSELELRRLVVGRANWLFVGSDESAEWTTTFS
jgi:transposase